MTVTLQLKPEVEATLAELAHASGMSVEQYLQTLVEGLVTGGAVQLSSRLKAAAWRESARRFPESPPLPDEAVSREGIYDDRS